MTTNAPAAASWKATRQRPSLVTGCGCAPLAPRSIAAPTGAPASSTRSERTRPPSVGRDRRRLERLCRYLARPPLSQERLSLHPDGRVRLAFQAPWKDGTHAVLLDPLDFIARLAALVPPPRFHLLRYHGVLAAHAAARAEVVPGRQPPSTPPQLPIFEPNDEPPLAPRTRHRWACLLERAFGVEVTTCPVEGCGGRMKIVELATEPHDIARVLSGEPRRARAPPTRRIAPPGQLSFAFG